MTDKADWAAGSGGTAGRRLNELLSQAGLPVLDPMVAGRFESYLSLILRWNSRINLTSIRGQEGILARHFLESIACAHAIPAGVGTLLDFGSGGGFPGIPIALCRPEIAVALAESQGKKSAFLQEAVRTLGLTTTVYSGRGETLNRSFDSVTLRAVERMESAVAAASSLVLSGGYLVVMTTAGELGAIQQAAGGYFSWSPLIRLPRSDERLIAIGTRGAARPGS